MCERPWKIAYNDHEQVDKENLENDSHILPKLLIIRSLNSRTQCNKGLMFQKNIFSILSYNLIPNIVGQVSNDAFLYTYLHYKKSIRILYKIICFLELHSTIRIIKGIETNKCLIWKYLLLWFIWKLRFSKTKLTIFELLWFQLKTLVQFSKSIIFVIL